MKRNQIKLFGIVVIAGLMLSSCWFMGPWVKGNGNVTEETRQVGEFDQIEVSRGMNVYIEKGTPASVKVIADSNLHEVIKTDVEGGVLKITVEANIRRSKEKKVMVTLDQLTDLEVSSGSNVFSVNQLNTDELDINASSGSNIDMNLNVQRLNADCSSGANIKLSGLATRADLEASSGANLKAKNLTIDDCRMSASSGANVFATVVKSIDAKASSGGNVTYYGNPVTRTAKASSGGNINND